MKNSIRQSTSQQLCRLAGWATPSILYLVHPSNVLDTVARAQGGLRNTSGFTVKPQGRATWGVVKPEVCPTSG